MYFTNKEYSILKTDILFFSVNQRYSTIIALSNVAHEHLVLFLSEFHNYLPPLLFSSNGTFFQAPQGDAPVLINSMGCHGDETDVGYCMADLKKDNCRQKSVGVDCTGVVLTDGLFILVNQVISLTQNNMS